MAVLNWGKPTVQIGVVGAGGSVPATWLELPAIVQGTAQLTTEAGNKTEAIAEGGDIVDVRYDKSKYTLELELFVKKGDAKPIDDNDGVIIDNYAVRLTPEDPAGYGFVMDNTSVACTETWTAADGSRWKYTFSGLKPATGKILKAYFALVVNPTTLEFGSAADTVGKPVTVTATGTVSAASNQTWATATVAGTTVTVKVTVNTGVARTATITISADGKQATVTVTQAAA
jgi:hypothetical protein